MHDQKNNKKIERMHLGKDLVNYHIAATLTLRMQVITQKTTIFFF